MFVGSHIPEGDLKKIKKGMCVVHEGYLYISTEMAAYLLGLHRTTLKSKIKAGKIKRKYILEIPNIKGHAEHYLRLDAVMELLKKCIVVDGKILFFDNEKKELFAI